MNRKITLFLVFCFFLVNVTLSQSKKILSRLRNDSFRYSLVITIPKLIDSNTASVSLVLVDVNLSKADKKELLKWKRETWMKLLLDENRNWAANLCLYDLFKKDATNFQIIKTDKDWKMCCREQDISFWKKELRE